MKRETINMFLFPIGLLVFFLGIIDTFRPDGFIYLSKILIGIAIILITCEKKEKNK